METARGRWFLSEYAKRNRSADTASILEALTKLEELAEPLEDAPSPADLRGVLKLLSEARLAPWQGVADRSGRPAHQRPQRAGESAVSAVRRAADKIREVAFELRETARLEIYANALELYCTDLTSAAVLEENAVRRLAELSRLLAVLESRLSVLVGDPDPIKNMDDGRPPANGSGPNEASAEPAGSPEPEPAAAVQAEIPEAEPTTVAPSSASPVPALADPAPPTQPRPVAQPLAVAQPAAGTENSAQVLMFVNPA